MKRTSHATKLFLALLIASTFALAGCNDGPFEEAGEDVDEAVEEVQDGAEDAADEIEDTVDG